MRFAKRKWGWYLTLISREHFKVKLLWFRRYGHCSMQFHNHRNELWCFLFGKGIMTLGRETLFPKAGHWMSVPTNSWHHYQAMKRTLVLEIQYGTRCDEDDIVRLES